MLMTTVIKNADWVIGWDYKAKCHVYLRNADVAFTGKVISFVGKSYQGAIDHKIDGTGLMVMPGLVNIHAHPGEDTYTMGLDEGFDAGEEGERAFYELLKSPRWQVKDVDLRPLSAEIGYADLLLSGVTTLVDISESSSYPGWIELLERSGLRAYLAPTFPSFTSKDSIEKQLAQALSIIDKAMASNTGRLSGVVLPFDVVSVPDDILRKSLAEARKRGIPWMIHAAEALFELKDVASKQGLTPIQLLDQLEILAPGTILAHAIYFDHHPALKNERPYKDMSIVAKKGASVSHAPYGFILNCLAMHSFGSYREAGINVGLGTDTFGHNMLEEMRLAMLISRVLSGRIRDSTTADIFHAATIGGAQALGRDDIGYLARNAKADFVLVDLNHPAMQPNNDPLRSLILQAGERAVRDVYIDGVKVVENGEVLALDYLGASKKLNEVMHPMRAEAVEREEEEGPHKAGSVFALSLRKGVESVNQIVNQRELLYGKIEDIPYGHSVPDVLGMVVRSVVPYGYSNTLDVAVMTVDPGFELKIEGYAPADKDYYVQGLSGIGVVEIDGKQIKMTPGTVLLLPPGTRGVIENRSDSDWVWFSIHHLIEEQYKIGLAEDEAFTEEYIKKAMAMTPGELVYAKIEEASFRGVPGFNGLSEHQLVLSQDFDVSLKYLQEGTRLPESEPLSYDLYVHGVAGTGMFEVEGKRMEVGPDMFAFLPEGTAYSLYNPTDADWEFIWMHRPEK